MEPQEIFKEVMKSEELQTYFGITKKEASSASYTGVSDHTPIEIIKDVINCVANRRTIPATFQGIMKKVSD
ncbi:hypothetical protein [Prevotella jejuni]|uniref:hypothetical protein n=1 Tax=Prevotella jejuni TaxID=1177574 RepID=UPI00352E4077